MGHFDDIKAEMPDSLSISKSMLDEMDAALNDNAGDQPAIARDSIKALINAFIQLEARVVRAEDA
ncbi:hypothetical protein AB0O58_11950 [Rhodococcus sp. NPDC080181]|uniref:hypothetical protein n=1 Tax=Rhodococcus sp. NPDC080181 TaxID=3155292 RepID=UPI003450E1A1